MNKWLNIFAYHIHIPWWTFGIAGGASHPHIIATYKLPEGTTVVLCSTE